VAEGLTTIEEILSTTPPMAGNLSRPGQAAFSAPFLRK